MNSKPPTFICQFHTFPHLTQPNSNRSSPHSQDASRLVFVSVKDAKPKRKVAVPIPEGSTWEAFCRSVQSKLKLSGIDSIYLVSSGELVTRLDQLQDIDELSVVEGSQQQQQQPSSNGYGPSSSGGYIQKVGISDTEITPVLSGQLDADADDDAKYAKKQSGIQLSMKRAFPGLFRQNSLPLTTRDLSQASPIEQVRRRVRRRKRSWTDPRRLLILFALMSCVGTLFYVYSKANLLHGLP